MLLNYVHNLLLAHSTRALLCVGKWSSMKLVAYEDFLAITAQPEKEGTETIDELESG